VEDHKILITGSHGFIGSALCTRLKKEGIHFVRLKRVEEDRPRKFTESDSLSIVWPHQLKDVDFTTFSTVVHLAIPSSRETSLEALSEPVKLFEAAIASTNPRCHFIFISSLSATERATSTYGKAKWTIQEMLLSSQIRWTILRPGLVVDVNNPRGLFGLISAIIQSLPIIPVPHGYKLLKYRSQRDRSQRDGELSLELTDGLTLTVQPIQLEDVVSAIVHIIQRPAEHTSKLYSLALSPRSLVQFTKDVTFELNIKRCIFPIPVKVAMIGLKCLETIVPELSVSISSLEGLMHGDKISSCSEAESALNVKLSPFGISQSVENAKDYDSELQWEAGFIFKMLFGVSPSERIVRRYKEAHIVVDANLSFFSNTCLSVDHIPSVRKLVSLGYSLELLERMHRNTFPHLSHKFQILSYLAEVDPQYRKSFFLSERMRIRAWVELAWSCILTSFMIINGWVISAKIAGLYQKRLKIG